MGMRGSGSHDVVFADYFVKDEELDDIDTRPEREDEKPVVVVLKKGDLTQEEVQEKIEEIIMEDF